MNRQKKQLLVVTIILIFCVAGYFATNSYYKNKEEKESESKAAESIEAFGITNYDQINSLTYTNEGETISLSKGEDGKWIDNADSSIDIDEDTIESNMLTCFASIEADSKIEDATDVDQYGFTTKNDEIVTASTNTIVFGDTDGNTYTLYIGDSNPYDSTKYYLMVEGDSNIYMIGSDLQTAFSKTVDDITETTTEASTETTESESE